MVFVPIAPQRALRQRLWAAGSGARRAAGAGYRRRSTPGCSRPPGTSRSRDGRRRRGLRAAGADADVDRVSPASGSARPAGIGDRHGGDGRGLARAGASDRTRAYLGVDALGRPQGGAAAARAGRRQWRRGTAAGGAPATRRGPGADGSAGADRRLPSDGGRAGRAADSLVLPPDAVGGPCIPRRPRPAARHGLARRDALPVDCRGRPRARRRPAGDHPLQLRGLPAGLGRPAPRQPADLPPVVSRVTAPAPAWDGQ